MANESTLNPSELINTENQLDSSLYIMENLNVSFGNTLEYYSF